MAQRAASRAAAVPRTRQRVGRPSRLSRGEILLAAERLADDGGAANVTMRRVASQLGVSTMALYRHVADKDALLLAVLDRQVGSRRSPRLPQDPRGRVLRLFRWLYEGVDERPWAVEVVGHGNVVAPSMVPRVEQIIAAFIELGLTQRQAADAYLACWRFTVGTLLLRHPSPRGEPDWPGGRGEFDYGKGLAAFVDGLLTRA
jgi:AcrR family transcriptional regulator